MRFLFFALMLQLSVLPFYSDANPTIITGKITDGKGNPVSFASILVKGTTTACSADHNGNFSIKVNQCSDLLVVSAIGYHPLEIDAAGRNFVNIILNRDFSIELPVIILSPFQIGRTIRCSSSNSQVISSEKINTLPKPLVQNVFPPIPDPACL